MHINILELELPILLCIHFGRIRARCKSVVSVFERCVRFAEMGNLFSDMCDFCFLKRVIYIVGFMLRILCEPIRGGKIQGGDDCDISRQWNMWKPPQCC